MSKYEAHLALVVLQIQAIVSLCRSASLLPRHDADICAEVGKRDSLFASLAGCRDFPSSSCYAFTVL